MFTCSHLLLLTSPVFEPMRGKFGVQVMILPVRESMADRSQVSKALAWAVGSVVAVYLVVGLTLSVLFSAADEGVEQVIILNLPSGSPTSTIVQATSALVAILSYPIPMMPLAELLGAFSCCIETDGAVPLDATPTATASATTRLRLALLALSSCTAVAMPHFGTLAGFIGCCSVMVSNVLPPLLHLRLISWPALSEARDERSPLATISFAVALDACLLALGVGAMTYFTALTGAQLVLS